MPANAYIIVWHNSTLTNSDGWRLQARPIQGHHSWRRMWQEAVRVDRRPRHDTTRRDPCACPFYNLQYKVEGISTTDAARPDAIKARHGC